MPRGSGHLSRAGLGVGTEAAVFFFFFWGGKFLNVVWETRMIISPPNVKKDGSFYLGYIEMAMEKENHFGDLCHGWYSMW